MRLKILLGIMFLSILITGCNTTTVDDSEATGPEVLQAVAGNNAFALDMFEELDNDQNLFFSPWSISSAMAMVYEGSNGETASEFKQGMHFPDKGMRPSFAYLYNNINKAGDYKLSTANALWIQKDFPVKDTYTSVIDKYYGGKVTNLDFIGETEKSRVTINNWVEDQTNNKIQDLIPQGYLDAMTRLVLTNAVYFKGTWVYEFDEKKTKNMVFKAASGDVTVPFMSLNEKSFNYYADEDLQVIELPYKGEKISMRIYLPREGKEADLSKDYELREEKVSLLIPKFKFETKYFMTENFRNLGVTIPFTPQADLSAMADAPLYIGFVIHQAYIDVNEEGTEAAAATAVGIKATSVERVELFNADHPFVFTIKDNETGQILFMGKVADPS